jgi:ABC-type Fe3+-siderophore transport system permease subunit
MRIIVKNSKVVTVSSGLGLIFALAILGFIQPSFIPIMTWLMFGVAVITLLQLYRLERSNRNHRDR